MAPILPALLPAAAKHHGRYGHATIALSALATGLADRVHVAHCVLTGHVVDQGPCPRCSHRTLA